MANVIKHKRGSGSDPSASDLILGELAIRTDTGKLFTKMDSGAIAEIAGGGSDIAINTLSSSSGTGGGSATFNGSAYRFTLSAPPSVSAAQLLVSINGVIQKPVAGTSQPSEGFSVDGTDIILGDAPATGSDFFILTFKSLGVSEPADNSVTSAKIVDGAIVNADINASAAIAKTKIETFVNNNGTTRLITGTNNVNELDAESNLTVNGSTITFAESTLTVSKSTLATVSAKETTGNKEIALRANTTGGVLRTIGSYPLIFEIAQAEKMRLDSSGRLLLGTTTEGNMNADDLTVSTTGNTGITIRSGTSSHGNIYFSDGTSGSAEYRGIIDYAHNIDAMLIYVAANERMRIDSSGKVGIGTTSPIQTLDVTGSNGVGIAEFTNTATSFSNDCYTVKIDSSAHTSNMTSAGAFAVDVNAGRAMAINGNGDVGIGTSSPTDKLHVVGDVEFTLGTDVFDVMTTGSGSKHPIRLLNADASAGNQVGIQFGPANNVVGASIQGVAESDFTSTANRDGALSFTTRLNGTLSEAMRITSAGNVAIGTTSPSSKLHVVGSITQTSAGAQNSHKFGSANPFFYGQFNSSGDASINNQASANLLLATANTERMRIDSSGRMLIGTTTEGEGFADELTVASSSNTGITIRSGTGNYGSLFFSDGTSGNAEYRGYLQYYHQTDTLIFGAAADERMRIDSNGHVLFTDGSSQRVAFGTSDNTKYAGFGRHDGAAQDVGLNFFTTTNAGTTFVNHFRIDHDGGLFGTDTTIASISDSRVKTDITDYTYDLEKFKQFTPKQFNWKNPEYHGEKTNVKGFLAQDLEAIDTQWVGSSFIEKDHPDYDLVDKSKNGQDEDVGVAKTSKFGAKDAMYISVINQLIARVEALEAK